MAFLDSPRELQETVGERGLPMVDVRDYGEVPYPFRRVLAQVDGALLEIRAGVRTEATVEAETRGGEGAVAANQAAVEQVEIGRSWGEPGQERGAFQGSQGLRRSSPVVAHRKEAEEENGGGGGGGGGSGEVEEKEDDDDERGILSRLVCGHV